jgi:hypothetical protein
MSAVKEAFPEREQSFMPASKDGENVIRLDSAQEALKRHFLGWQCRLRQHAMRKNGGRPSAGMCPSVEFGEEGSARAELVILISQKDSSDATAKFRHMVRKTHDPKERLDGAVKELSAAYFQYPEEFSDVMTALFGPTSGIADRLVAAGRGVLRFDQYSQKYTIPCRVDLVAEADPAWQATFWHNSLFNPNIPGGTRVLAFTPNWAEAQADPPIA